MNGELKPDDYMYVDVRDCARCGGDHDHVIFKPLRNAADEWDWWGTCPALGQPIFVKVIEQK